MQSIARQAELLRPGMHRCPAHDDKSPSLSSRRAANGNVLLHCHAGCRTADVLAAAGLVWGDLFANPRTTTPRRSVSPLVDARQAVLEDARRQPWARSSSRDLYLAADALRYADRVRASTTTDSAGAWDVLAMTAALTTEAEALWSEIA